MQTKGNAAYAEPSRCCARSGGVGVRAAGAHCEQHSQARGGHAAASDLSVHVLRLRASQASHRGRRLLRGFARAHRALCESKWQSEAAAPITQGLTCNERPAPGAPQLTTSQERSFLIGSVRCPAKLLKRQRVGCRCSAARLAPHGVASVALASTTPTLQLQVHSAALSRVLRCCAGGIVVVDAKGHAFTKSGNRPPPWLARVKPPQTCPTSRRM